VLLLLLGSASPVETHNCASLPRLAPPPPASSEFGKSVNGRFARSASLWRTGTIVSRLRRNSLTRGYCCSIVLSEDVPSEETSFSRSSSFRRGRLSAWFSPRAVVGARRTPNPTYSFDGRSFGRALEEITTYVQDLHIMQDSSPCCGKSDRDKAAREGMSARGRASTRSLGQLRLIPRSRDPPSSEGSGSSSLRPHDARTQAPARTRGTCRQPGVGKLHEGVVERPGPVRRPNPGATKPSRSSSCATSGFNFWSSRQSVTSGLTAVSGLTSANRARALLPPSCRGTLARTEKPVSASSSQGVCTREDVPPARKAKPRISTQPREYVAAAVTPVAVYG